MLTNQQIEGIKKSVNDGETLNTLEWFARSQGEDAGEVRAIIRATMIRRWLRRNKYTTRKGSLHILRGHCEAADLWTSIQGVSGSADGMTWECRKIDDLRNLYIQL